MVILQETVSSQNLDFIARDNTYAGTVDLLLTDESTNTTTTTSYTTTVVSYYLRISGVFTLKEERNYYFVVYKTGGQTEANLLFRGKIYCTNQTISEYSINDGVYTEHDEMDNEYVVYE